MRKLTTYKVWIDEGEEWGEDTILQPDAIVSSSSPQGAAIHAIKSVPPHAQHRLSEPQDMIVEDDNSMVVVRVATITTYEATSVKPTSVHELMGLEP